MCCILMAKCRAISAKLALEVMLEAHRAGHMRNKKALKELKNGGEEALMRYIKCHMCASEPYTLHLSSWHLI